MLLRKKRLTFRRIKDESCFVAEKTASVFALRKNGSRCCVNTAHVVLCANGMCYDVKEAYVVLLKQLMLWLWNG